MDELVKTIPVKHPDYPALLGQIHDPPTVLYVKGTLLKQDEAAVAIVGTRAATPYGLSVARRLGQELARCGITVVSGLAEGIDRAAQEGALEAQGRTLAVLGHGLSMVYPPFHRELAQRVVRSGALISEFPWETGPTPWNFPKRNRIISGLSLGVVVVEAPPKSGALITARQAMEQGREVFAVPGPVSAIQSRGTHQLLRDGAKLVETARDVLEELAPQLKHQLESWGETEAQAQGFSAEERKIWEAISTATPLDLESLAQRTELPPSRLLPVLTDLELKGAVQRLPGNAYTRRCVSR